MDLFYSVFSIFDDILIISFIIAGFILGNQGPDTLDSDIYKILHRF